MVNLINEKYATYYHANKMSSTFLFCIIIYFLMMIVPFLIGFTSNDFWIRAASYYEQPTITSLDQYILEVKTTNNSYFYTNIPDILRERGSSNMLPQVQISSQSDNSLVSEIPKPQNFTISITLQQQAVTIQSIQLISFYQYQLTGTVKMTMQSFADVSLTASSGMSYGTVVGQIHLQQRHPLYSGDVYRTRYNYPPYYDQDGALLQNQQQIIEANIDRNETIFLNYNSLIRPAISNTGCHIDVMIQVPKNQEVIYIATLLETLKFAWVQYFSFFLIFWWFGQHLLSFLIENGVYTTSKSQDLPYKKKYQ